MQSIVILQTIAHSFDNKKNGKCSKILNRTFYCADNQE